MVRADLIDRQSGYLRRFEEQMLLEITASAGRLGGRPVFLLDYRTASKSPLNSSSAALAEASERAGVHSRETRTDTKSRLGLV